MARRSGEREERETAAQQQANAGQQQSSQQEQQHYQQQINDWQQQQYRQQQSQQQQYQQQQYQQQQYQQANNWQQQPYQQQANDWQQQQQYQQQTNNWQQQQYQQQANNWQQQYQQANNWQQQQYYQQPTAPVQKKKKKTARRVVFFVLELILLAVMAGALYIAAQYSKIEKVEIKKDEIKEQIRAQLPDQVEETLKGYWNIALYGVDSREGSTEMSLSDTIMIASVNRDTKDVKLVSVYRDTYLDNTNGDYRKATECYMLGGAERSINMLNKNLDLDITNFVTVNMNVLAEVVDSIGGIEIDVRSDEIDYLNGYQNEGSEITGKEIIPVTTAGLQTLNGLQALSYCRIRYTEAVDSEHEGMDYERTLRQRVVLEKILEKVQQMDILSLTNLITTLLPYVSTNLTETEILSLAKDISSYHLVGTKGFPFEKIAIQLDGNDIVTPINLAQNVSELHEYLFDVTDYTPSDTVQEISNYITSVTGY